MNITVGGRFNEPNWSKLIETVKKLKNAGHTILAPSEDSVPINPGEAVILFQGDENKTVQEIATFFLDCIEKSDAYVVVDCEGVYGGDVFEEIGFATGWIINNQESPLKKIYFTEPPACYNLFLKYYKSTLTYEIFKAELFQNPENANALNMYKKYRGIYKDLEEFFYSEKWFFFKIKILIDEGIAEFGIDSLLNKNQIQDENDQDENDIEK